MSGIRGRTTSSAIGSKAILHVECCTTRPEESPDVLAKQVEEWLRLNRAGVGLRELFVSFLGLPNAQNVEHLRIGDISTAVDYDTRLMVTLSDVKIDVDIFDFGVVDDAQLAGRPNGSLGNEQDEGTPQAKIINLPSRRLSRAWDSLIFEDPVQFRLLKFVLSMVSISAQQLRNDQSTTWNRLVLLYGPPGTGKTTLCRAVAQQISIRLRKTYPASKLIEIDAHSLFSKYFSESGKAVSKLFGMIESLLNAEAKTFVCVVIDEIESLASARQCSSSSSEPQDTLRAVNALLIALDSLRNRSNVVVLCTSNLIEAMDPAFLDRVDLKLHIPEPCAEARYEILRACYLELATSGIVTAAEDLVDEDMLDTFQVSEGSPARSQELADALDDDFLIIEEDFLPVYDIMLLHHYGKPDSWPRRLWDIAQKSANLSGRTLHRLPVLSLALYTVRRPCPMDQALDALSKAVDDELRTEQRLQAIEARGSTSGSSQRRVLFA